MELNKAKIDAYIEMTREFWNKDYSFDDLESDAVLDDCRRRRDYAEEAFGWEFAMSFNEILTGVLGSRGLKPDATNEDIYKVLEVLGYEVTE